MTTTARRTRARTMLALLLLFVAAPDAVAYEPPEVYVPGIIATWEEQAGSQRDTVGFALSVVFINWPSIFLREMSRRPEAVKSWLDSVERHTVSQQDEPGRVLWVAQQMHAVEARWEGVRYREMTESIRRTTEPDTGRHGPTS